MANSLECAVEEKRVINRTIDLYFSLDIHRIHVQLSPLCIPPFHGSNCPRGKERLAQQKLIYGRVIGTLSRIFLVFIKVTQLFLWNCSSYRSASNICSITRCTSGPWGTGTSMARTAAQCCSTVCQRRLVITSCVIIVTNWTVLFL